jgi:hypothetical protein
MCVSHNHFPQFPIQKHWLILPKGIHQLFVGVGSVPMMISVPVSPVVPAHGVTIHHLPTHININPISF